MERASIAETSPIAEREKAEEQKLKHWRLADVVSQSRPAGYYSSRCTGSLAVSAPSRKNTRLLPALRDDGFESRKLPLATLLHFASISEEHRDTLCFGVEEVKFLRHLLWNRGAYQYAENRAVEGWNVEASRKQQRPCASTGCVRRSLRNGLQNLRTVAT